VEPVVTLYFPFMLPEVAAVRPRMHAKTIFIEKEIQRSEIPAGQGARHDGYWIK
jgi:hypothetical protein